MTNELKVIQANLHHSKAATDVLIGRFVKERFHVALIQEPWVYDGKIRGIPSSIGKLIYDFSSSRPRAALLISKNLNFLTIPFFLRTDIAAAQMKVKISEAQREVIFTSAYFPGEEVEAPPAYMEELAQYSATHKIPIVVGCDANAHHTIWGSTDTNSRGESLFNFLALHNLETLNEGNEPTFVNAIRQEVLDLTITSPELANLCTKWHVSKEASLSDHMHISLLRK